MSSPDPFNSSEPYYECQDCRHRVTGEEYKGECPECGFECDRDANAAYNVLARGLEDVGVVHSEGTPVETALPTSIRSMDAKRVMEPGSPALNEARESARAE